MVLFNYSTRELTAKIVYYGPGLCGKTTNLQYVYDSLPETVKKGKMLSLATKTDRTLFFDFLPIELGTIRGMKTRIQLYTVPGQVFYNSTRKLVLKGADGVVFVADSQVKMVEADVESYKNLEENLQEMGIKIDEIPLVMQFNKRDLPNVSSVEEMNAQINRHNAPFYEAVAMTGIGVEDTLKAITKLVLNNLSSKYKVEGAGTVASSPQPAARASSPAREAAPRPAPPATEEIALETLEVEEEAAPAPPPPRPATARPAPVAARAVAPPEAQDDDVLELVDEVAGEPPASREGWTDLGEDLLEELEEEPVRAAATPPARPSPARPAPQAPPALRAVPPPRPAAQVPADDLDEPIDLEEDWEAPPAREPAPAGRPGPVDLGAMSPGEDRVVDLPVEIKVNGRLVRIDVRITVRLPA